MSFVFKINEELAAVTVTATELLSITRTISGFIKATAFLQDFNEIIAEINKSYGVVIDSFSPFYGLDNEEKFSRHFDEKFETFKGRYLMDVSKPRRYCDNVYDAYIKMQQTKEAKTNFPPLKRSFSRLDTFYDKWITNDNLLGMSIDGALKLKNRLLTEIAQIKLKDTEDAYIIFSSAFEDFHDFLTLIRVKSETISDIVTP
jgi:hypothetical protein